MNRKEMTKRQQIALLNPCARAMDTINHAYHDYTFPYSTILTVNK